jgi:hypothetical protein
MGQIYENVNVKVSVRGVRISGFGESVRTGLWVWKFMHIHASRLPVRSPTNMQTMLFAPLPKRQIAVAVAKTSMHVRNSPPVVTTGDSSSKVV